MLKSQVRLLPGALKPDSPQGGEAVCKTVAVGMAGSIPASGTNSVR